MPGKQKKAANSSAEEKLKAAARKIFTQKGYAGTRTRDIAEEAGLNLALLNYYFRSKEKLFEIIMLEKVQELFGVIAPVLNDASSTLQRKVELISVIYIDMLVKNPNLPLFVLSEIRNHPHRFGNNIEAGKLLRDSCFIRQLQEKKPDTDPLHFMMTILGMIVFPFIGKPVFQAVGAINNTSFNKLLEERKKLIPLWVKMMLKAK